MRHRLERVKHSPGKVGLSGFQMWGTDILTLGTSGIRAVLEFWSVISETFCLAELVDRKGGEGPGQQLGCSWQFVGSGSWTGYPVSDWRLVTLMNNQAFGNMGQNRVTLLTMSWETGKRCKCT